MLINPTRQTEVTVMRSLIVLVLSLGLLGPAYAMSDDAAADRTFDESTVDGEQ